MFAAFIKTQRSSLRPKAVLERDVADAKQELAKAVARRDHVRSRALLETLEALEPAEPRWPHRLGDLLRAAGRAQDAAGAYRRACVHYQERGFVGRAAAMKVVARSIGGRSVHLTPLHTSIAPEPSSR